MSIRTAAAHRNLLYLLSRRELRTRYKRSLLGWLWSLLNPLVQMAIFSVIFLYVFIQDPPIGDPSGLENFPLYFLCGFIPFNFFSISVGVSIIQDPQQDLTTLIEQADQALYRAKAHGRNRVALSVPPDLNEPSVTQPSNVRTKASAAAA